MKMLGSKEFRRYVTPVAIINSIFCTGLVEYFTDRSTQAIGLIYNICAIISYCKGFSMLINKMHDKWSSRATDFEIFMIHFQFCHNIVVYAFSIIAGLLRRKRVQLSIKQLENCARAMDELGIPESYSPLISHKYLVLLSFGFLLIILVITELCFIHNNNNYAIIALYCFTDNIPTVASFIIDFSFIYWIRYAKIKFVQLNTVLRSMLKTTIDSPQHRRVLRLTDKWKDSSTSSNIIKNSKTYEDIRKLKRIKNIHLELVKFARNTNEAYGLHILMSMATCFLLITTLLYNLYFTVTTTKWLFKSIGVFIFTYWISFLGLELFFVNHICAVTSIEIFIIFPHAAETGDILCELYEPSACKEFRDMVRQFMYQIVQNPLTFTAWGFFDLDYTFLNNVIGSITTYLVILIQVGHGSNKGSKNSVENSTSTI